MNDQIKQRLASYFGNGGLFNPEMMDHDKVRDLIQDCRTALEGQEQRIRDLEQPMELTNPQAILRHNSRLQKENNQLEERLQKAEADLLYEIDKGFGLAKKVCETQDRLKAVEKSYNELIFAVSQKFLGETRHETALRYILEREMPSNTTACDTQPTEPKT